MTSYPQLIAYADGSGTVSSMPAGCGVVILDDDYTPLIEASWFLGNGTNNFAELSAVRVALLCLLSAGRAEHRVEVRTDSMYTIQSLTAPNDCPTGRPNAGLINDVRSLLRAFPSIQFRHVRGHNGEAWNERADELAGRARRLGL